MKIHPEIIQALKDTGLPWRIERGRKHYKVFVNNEMALVLSGGRNARKAGFGGAPPWEHAAKKIRRRYITPK